MLESRGACVRCAHARHRAHAPRREPVVGALLRPAGWVTTMKRKLNLQKRVNIYWSKSSLLMPDDELDAIICFLLSARSSSVPESFDSWGLFSRGSETGVFPSSCKGEQAGCRGEGSRDASKAALLLPQILVHGLSSTGTDTQGTWKRPQLVTGRATIPEGRMYARLPAV